MKIDNAVILAAGTSSRFAPLSFETHKALIEVKGEVLIERQIRQLKEAGISEIYLVTGYKSKQFEYLKEKLGVLLLYNPDYRIRNNNSSIHIARDVLCNSYLCSADNYFPENPFEDQAEESFYSAVFSEGKTEEWCMTEDAEGYINSVTIGGEHAWYMLGHTFWSEEFSKRFLSILEEEYDRPETAAKLWESIFREHLSELKMKIRKYEPGSIFEFDTLDDLRKFDPSYFSDTRSKILKKAALRLGIGEEAIREVKTVKDRTNEAVGCTFLCPKGRFRYLYEEGHLYRCQ